MTTLVNGGNSGTYKLTVDGKDYQGKYGEVLKIMLPADSKAHNISVVDNVSAECKGNAQTDLLLPCSVPCTINATVLSFDCNNGGTTSDTGDDTYTVTISATASNGGTGFTAVVDGKSTDGLYGQNLILNFKADNVVFYTITITDKNNTVCTAVISTPLLAPCSGPCEITAVASNIVCNNNGTNNTDADDVFTFDLLVTGNNTQWKTDQFGGVEGFVGNKRPWVLFPLRAVFLHSWCIMPTVPTRQNVNITLPPTCSACTQTADAGNGGELSCTQNAILLTGTASPNGVNQWYLNGNLVTTATTLIAGEPGWYHFVATTQMAVWLKILCW